LPHQPSTPRRSKWFKLTKNNKRSLLDEIERTDSVAVQVYLTFGMNKKQTMLMQHNVIKTDLIISDFTVIIKSNLKKFIVTGYLICEKLT
jgi:hypothetical protein